ncbi:phosphate uptake regulator [Methanohalophilus levihalophilus]|nr:phosphate uptake regulator PhoU [Methanohalophilus levihalophilus]MBP2030630.1 phosphate uptake regulator [Methanohalophilus levihalophilus]
MDISDQRGAALVRNLIAAYVAGYDIIELKSSRILAEQKKVIRDICHKLIGPEIIEETSKSVLIQDLLNPEEVSIKKSIRRMFLISNSMQKDAISALKHAEKDLALDVMLRDDEVDRLFLLISKQFRSLFRGTRLADMRETTVDEYHDFRMVAASLERIADHAQRIASVAKRLEEPVPEDLMKPLEEASSEARIVVENSIDALYGSDVKLANKVLNEMEDFKAKTDRLNVGFLKMDNVEMAIGLGSVVDSIERTADYGTNIAETAINMAIAMKSEEN